MLRKSLQRGSVATIALIAAVQGHATLAHSTGATDLQDDVADSHIMEARSFAANALHSADEMAMSAELVAEASELAAEASAADDDPPRGSRSEDNAVLSARLPIVVEGRRFQSVPVTATVTQVLTISPAVLADALQPILSDAGRELLDGLGSGQVPVSTLAEFGFLIRLDPQTLSVAVDVPADQRAIERFSLLNMEQFPETEQVFPSAFSGGVTGTFAITDNSQDGASPAMQLGFFGFANFGGLRGLNVDYGGVVEHRAGRTSFRRDAIVAFIDQPEQALRYSAGDLLPVQPTLSGSVPILGVSIERSYQQLQPQRLIRPTGRRSFLLQQAATVEIYANNVLVNRFAAGPGPVDLADIPVANLSNDISIVVEDALGRRELDSFSLANDVSLLGAGLDEFSFAFGLMRNTGNGGFDYSQDWAFSGSYIRGISERVTIGAHAAATKEFQNAGSSIAFGALRGVFLLEGAISHSTLGRDGYAAGAAYRGGNLLPQRWNDVLTARVDYSSRDFATLSDMASFSIERWRAAVDYRFDVDESTSFLIGATYTDKHDRRGSDRFLSAGVSRRFGRFQLSVTGRTGEDALGRGDTGVFLTLSRIFGTRTIATATYDSISDAGRIEVARNRRIQAPDFSYRVGLQRRPGQQEAFGQASYFGTRFEADARILSDVGGARISQGTTSTLRLQSGIGFADGSVAIGRDPGRGFFMVRRHPSLSDADLRLYQGRARTQPLASTGGFGPALAPVTTPYRPTELTVDVTGAPAGYDVGDTRFVVLPGARSGVVLQVGTDAYRWRLATLQFEGRPVRLAYGELVNLESGERTAFFTNATGRASFASLRPGEYEIRLVETAVRSRFTVVNNDAAFIDMGVINLERIP